MTKITSEEVRHVAKLARLKVSETEVETFTKQLEELLEHFSAMSAINTAGVSPTSHPIEINNVFRKDIVKTSLTQEDVLSNAPKAQDQRFVVPQILGESDE